MKTAKLLSAFVLALTLGLSPTVARAAALPLNASFVKKSKDRATLDTDLFVDHYHKSPNSIIKDGDIHIAGRDTTILLPLVVEILNGALMKEARARLKVTSPDRSIPVSGAWRLWFEHPGREPQIQGEPVPIPYAYAMKLKERGVDDRSDVEVIDLPYEMIIAAAYEEAVEE